MQLIIKAFYRIYRIITGRKGIYGEIGRHNRFTKGVFIAGGAQICKYNYFGPYIMINNKVIGNYCYIAPEVKIGDEAIIGANDVVIHDIPDYGMSVGISAKVIKHRFSHEIIDTIKTSIGSIMILMNRKRLFLILTVN